MSVGPTVEFDPARSLATGARFLPFPNDLVRNPVTGKLALSAQACERPAALNTRVSVLNTLDGFGTYQVPIQVTFTDEFDETSLAGNIAFYKVTSVGPSAAPVPFITRKTTTLRFATGDCSAPETVHALVIIPTVPLSQKSTYVVGLKRGIKTVSGEFFAPSVTWSLVSAKESPVTLDADGNVVSDRTPLDPSDEAERTQLRSLYQLWKALEAPLVFFDQTTFFNGLERSKLLVATSFTTQTVTDQLDPSVATSPAAKLSASTFLQPFGSIAAVTFPSTATALCGGAPAAECFLRLSLGGCKPATTGCTATHAGAGALLCRAPDSTTLTPSPPGTYDCAQVGDILATALGTVNYQTQIPNTLAASTGVTVKPLQGAWTDPVNPTNQGALQIPVLATVPTGTAPTAGWPVVIFGHTLTGSKENLLAIAGRLSRMGFAAVAIDFSQHGSRAVRTSTAIALACKGHCFNGTTDTGTECETIAQCGSGQTCGNAAGTFPTNFLPPNPTDAPQCYASIFTADFANTRDNIRQTVLDLERLVNALKTCSGTTCGALKVDPTRIFYGGTSLGTIVGTMLTAMSPDIKAAALNAGGVGWLDILENTSTLALRCPLVNNLIDAGILMGDKWAGGTSVGLCTTDAWKMQPGYATFSAVARWIMDPADPANFALRLRAKTHLIQQITDDTVIPNISTQRQAGLTGVAAMVQASSAFNPGAPTTESAAISTAPTASKYITYTTDSGHLFANPSLLKPAAITGPGFGGVWRLQIDFVQFLDNNDDANN